MKHINMEEFANGAFTVQVNRAMEKTSLAPELGAVTTMTCGTNLKTGDIEAVEIGNELPGQMTFDENTMYGNEAVQVDTETGEIIGNNKIVDLRKVGEA